MSAFGVRAWGRALEQSRVRRAPAHRGGAVTRDVSEQGWSEKEAHTAHGPGRAVRAQDGCAGRWLGGRRAEPGGHPVRGGAWDTTPVPREGESRLRTAEQGLAGPGRGDAWYRGRRHGCELVAFNREAAVRQKMDVE